MNLDEMMFGALLDATAAKTPVPGGGAVTGAVGALAAALGGMVVSYSVGKKSLAAHQGELEDAARTLAHGRAMMLELAAEDAQAYALVNELMRLDAGDPRREREMPAAAEAATRIPLALIAACADLLRLMDRLPEITNPHLRSDLAIAAVLTEATARASRWNVAINMGLWREVGLAGDPLAEAEEMLFTCSELVGRIERACNG
ncbi:MAG: cyclodeaminase/cyclohydrolase family protein [Phycisphaerales bacterium]|nr:cyclodeaminase/cyclohydrolase family protein [Phycisphaerales bacterium]